jgi:hypothetical protein
MTKIELYDIANLTTLESNKSLRFLLLGSNCARPCARDVGNCPCGWPLAP